MVELTPPSKLFALELEEVAEKAQDLVAYVKTANALPDAFQKEPLNLLCTALVHLPAGSAAGAYATLDYARRRLPFFRPAARAKDQQPDEDTILRGEELDKKLMPLFMAVGSAIEVYLSETGEEDIEEPKDPAVTPTEAERKSLAELDKEAQHAQQDLTEIQKALDNWGPDKGGVLELRRSIVDTQNHLGVGRAEISLPEPKPKLLARISGVLIESVEALGEFFGRLSYAAEPAAEELGEWVKRKITGSVKAIGSVGRGLRVFSQRLKEYPGLLDQQGAKTTLPPYDAEEARAMIIRGEAPPEHWRSEIVRLDLSGEVIPSLIPLSVLGSLQYLNLNGISISDSDFWPILGTQANATFPDRSEMNLAPLSGLVSLKHLTLSNIPVSDLRPLSTLTRLVSLNLENTSVSKLSPLFGLKSLRYLNLARTKIVNLWDLNNHKNLKTVDLRGCMGVDMNALNHKGVHIITSYGELT